MERLVFACSLTELIVYPILEVAHDRVQTLPQIVDLRVPTYTDPEVRLDVAPYLVHPSSSQADRLP